MSSDTSTPSCSSGAKLETAVAFKNGMFSMTLVNARGEVGGVLNFEAKNVLVIQIEDELRIKYLISGKWTTVELENEEKARRIFEFVTKMMMPKPMRFPIHKKESPPVAQPRSTASVFGEMERALQASESKKETKPTPKDVLAMLREAAEEDMVASLNDTSFFDALRETDSTSGNEPSPNAQTEEFAAQQAKWLAEYDSKNYICHFGTGEY